MKNEKTITIIVKIFWIFIIGSILGYVIEMIVALIQNGHFVSRQGLLFGPFTPVYGIGLVVYYFLLKNQDNVYSAFLYSMVVGGIMEYIFSFTQEKLFGTISWDYSSLPFNINGRTSLLHCTFWGLGGILYVKLIKLYILKLNKFLDKNKYRMLSYIFIVFMIINIVITYVAANRQKERMLEIEKNGVVDVFIDKYFPDEVMDKVFENKIEKI